MLKVHPNFQKVLQHLTQGELIKLTFDGSDITVRFLEDASKLSLTTSVYAGGNYIPPSVRRCLSHKFLICSAIHTHLTVDEKSFQIFLNYTGDAELMDHSQFKALVEEFGLVAEKWRAYLDEHDKNDLIHVRVK